jgi:hypothetical protein
MRQRHNSSVSLTLERLRRPWSGTSICEQLREARTAHSEQALALSALDRCASTLAFWLERLRLTRFRAALLALAEHPSAEALAEVHRLATGQYLGSIDPNACDSEVEALLEDARLHAIGRLLAAESPRFSAVGLGIALLGRSKLPADRLLLLELGASEELTSCVAEALSVHGAHAVFSLAQRARGKARCLAIEWLADAEAPEICDWLLREGARDAERHHHIAYLCASVGGLSQALSADRIDDALLRGAGQLLHLLATSVSAPDISDYDEAPGAVADFVRHTRSRTLSPELRDALAALAECPYLEPGQAAACRKRLAQARFNAAATPQTLEEVPSLP